MEGSLEGKKRVMDRIERVVKREVANLKKSWGEIVGEWQMSLDKMLGEFKDIISNICTAYQQ
jgi:hypothetical protein